MDEEEVIIRKRLKHLENTIHSILELDFVDIFHSNSIDRRVIYIAGLTEGNNKKFICLEHEQSGNSEQLDGDE